MGRRRKGVRGPFWAPMSVAASGPPGAVGPGSRQGSLAAQSTSASKAGRAADALAWFAMATST